MSQQDDLDQTHVLLSELIASSVPFFETRLSGGYLLIDKTQAIRDFLSSPRPQHLVLRPRRSGKSTMIGMFKAFFEKRPDSKTEAQRNLFRDHGLKIYQSPLFELHFSKYTIIHIDYSKARSETTVTIEAFETQVALALRTEVHRHASLGHLNDLDDDEKHLMDKIYRIELSGNHLANSYYNLSRILHKNTGRKIIVLLDEYDTPLNSSKNRDLYSHVEIFLRQMYSTLLRRNPCIFGALIVGILHAEKSSFISGIPSLQIFPLSPDRSLYADACLFTEDEVLSMYNYHKTRLPFSFETMQQWYKGYFSGGQWLYNPWTLCRSFETGTLQLFWHESGSAAFLMEKIFSPLSGVFQDLVARLLSKRPVECAFSKGIPHLEFSELCSSQLCGLLYSTGYLTRVAAKTFQIPTGELQWALLDLVSCFVKDLPVFQEVCGDLERLVSLAIDGPPQKFRSAFRQLFQKQIDRHSKLLSKSKSISKRKLSKEKRRGNQAILASIFQNNALLLGAFRAIASETGMVLLEDVAECSDCVCFALQRHDPADKAAILALILDDPRSLSRDGLRSRTRLVTKTRPQANQRLKSLNIEHLRGQLPADVEVEFVYCIAFEEATCNVSSRSISA